MILNSDLILGIYKEVYHYSICISLFFTLFIRRKRMKIETHLKPYDYSEKDVCRIVNPKQCLLYIKNGVFPIDIYTSVDPN